MVLRNTIFAFLALIILTSCDPSRPDKKCSVTIDYSPPINYVDGTPLVLTDIGKFTIYVKDGGHILDNNLMIVDVMDVNLTMWTITITEDDIILYLHMTATTLEGEESAVSNTATKLC